MLVRIPQVFISYSWTSEAFQQQVKELAERLVHDGVQVKLDLWDLKEGYDKYAFMEQCVTNPEIDKVLIICDSGYTAKANKRQGGVGDETAIISAEVYGNAEQEKFVPVIMERDENGEPYMPAYLKSRMYKDLTGENYSEGYKSLLRSIYGKPAERRTELGSRPAWLDEEEPSELFSVKEARQKIERINPGQLQKVAAQEFVDVYMDSLKCFYKKKFTNEEYLKDFEEMKEFRDVFLDYIKQISQTTEHFGEFMADTFEKMYNTLYNAEFYEPGTSQSGYNSFDIFRVHIWELFICTTTYLLHNEDYKSINELLVHTYYLRTSPLMNEVKPASYEKLRFYSKVMEERIKPQMPGNLSRMYTLTGNYLCTERAYLPIFSGKRIAEADLFLYQVYNGLNLGMLTEYGPWFPTCYIYAEEFDSMWKKLESKRFCEKIMLVFGVDTIEKLKERLIQCVPDREMRYSSGHVMPASAIMDWVKIEDIARLP